MIEDKDLGLKIAESTTEALWVRVKDNTAQRITEIKNTLIIEEALLELAEKKIKELNIQPKEAKIPTGVN